MQNIINTIQQKAAFLNNLSANEVSLFDYINTNQNNLEEVLQNYRPYKKFKPVNTLRFLVASELKKGHAITVETIEHLKTVIESRDISSYYNLDEDVKQSLLKYKQSRMGMFPNWKHNFKILFPFIHSKQEDDIIKAELEELANQIIMVNGLQHVSKHIVSFQGSQNYGTDHVWLAIIPNTSANVQYAYQLFMRIDIRGLLGGIHKGHNLVNSNYNNIDRPFNTWEDYIENTKATKNDWEALNLRNNVLFTNDEKFFTSTLKKMDRVALNDYFSILDDLVLDLEIQNDEQLVFNVIKSRLRFKVGNHYCFNVKRNLFDYAAYVAPGKSELITMHRSQNKEDIMQHYEALTDFIDANINENGSDVVSTEDNRAFRKAVFDKEYRAHILKQNNMQKKYYLVGAYWHDNTPTDQTERFVENNIWVNGYDDKFLDKVKNVSEGSFVAIKSVDRKGDKMFIKARGVVLKNKNDGKNLSIKWETNFTEFKVNFSGGYWDTITEVTKKNHIDIIWNNKESIMEKVKKYNPPINQIFYGPPGTGKTYNTIFEAAKIVSQDKLINYQEALTVFNNNLGNRIEFITFHQNYSYEGFIQGLRPDIEQKELSFNRADGVFTKMVTHALFEYYKIYQSNQKEVLSQVDTKIDLNDVYIEFVNSLSEGQEFETKTGSKIKVNKFTDKQNIEFKPLNGLKSYLVSGNRLLKLYKVYKSVNEIERIDVDIREVIGGCNATIYYVALREFIDFLKVYIETSNEFIDEYIVGGDNYESVTYSRKKELLLNFSLEELRSITTDEVTKYVIIIDEINRANISRVFGELITLIEPDKRSHGKIPLKATLPSGEQFIVPSNLYIVGTMNTADKSIALLDIALRRRFEFIPMYPDSSSTSDKIVNDSVILDAINKEIISRKGYDFTIGHSYFMGEDYMFKNTIDNKVIPLLLEYFMNDYEEVKKILNAANIVVEGWPMKMK